VSYTPATFYPHKRNKDGSYESVCMNCFQTVGTSQSEEELTELDKAHTCSPSPLSQRGTRRPVSNPD
jgi:hypothetical protein